MFDGLIINKTKREESNFNCTTSCYINFILNYLIKSF